PGYRCRCRACTARSCGSTGLDTVPAPLRERARGRPRPYPAGRSLRAASVTSMAAYARNTRHLVASSRLHSEEPDDLCREPLGGFDVRDVRGIELDIARA